MLIVISHYEFYTTNTKRTPSRYRRYPSLLSLWRMWELFSLQRCLCVGGFSVSTRNTDRSSLMISSLLLLDYLLLNVTLEGMNHCPSNCNPKFQISLSFATSTSSLNLYCARSKSGCLLSKTIQSSKYASLVSAQILWLYSL